MTKDEALKLALEALKKSHICPLLPDDCSEAITAIKEALAQPEQEPVAWYVERQHVGFRDHGMKLGPFWKRADAEEWVDDKQILKHLYPIPPQRKPLTEEEIFSCENSVPDETVTDRDWCIYFARAIEAAHGIKGGI